MGILAVCYASFVTADDSSALQEKLSQMNGLKANFQQQVIDVNNKIIQQGKGKIALERPNKLYWHLTSPDESMIVADGKDVWIYNPFAEEVTVMGIQDVIAASPIALLVHTDKKIWQQYQVLKQGDCYQITPLDNDSQVVGVNVCFAQDKLNKFTILDTQGNKSEFLLSNQTPLTTADSKLFDFIVPSQVDVDDQRNGD